MADFDYPYYRPWTYEKVGDTWRVFDREHCMIATFLTDDDAALVCELANQDVKKQTECVCETPWYHAEKPTHCHKCGKIRKD